MFIHLYNGIKKQKELQEGRDEGLDRIGDMLQKIRDLDYKENTKERRDSNKATPYFFSDMQNLD